LKSLKGVNTLLMTPFTETGEIDEKSLCRHIDHVIDGGANSLVAMGKIGEFDVLTMEERRRTMKVVVDYVGGRVPVGFGIINATFEDGLTLGRYAAEAKGDFVMSRPPVDGDIMEYFLRLADSISIMPYDQGVRGELSIEGDILPLTQKIDNVVALKISGNPDKNYEAKRLLDVPVLCGWDLMSLLAYQMGSDGVISGSASLVPRHEVDLYELAMQERWEEARALYYGTLVPILNYCTFDPFAYSVCKYMLYWQGVIDTPRVRAPNPDAGEARAKEALAVMHRVGVETKVPA
jgi:4-hydroxy-tetrahydrodipicolinate synthase